MKIALPLLAAVVLAQTPRYASKAVMQSPADYRDWYFVGSNLGVSYSPEPGKEHFFKNIYIQKSAAGEFKKTGVFPEKTMLVMEVYKPATDASPAKRGQFEGQFVGIEVAVKDKDAVAEGWAYYNFIGENGQSKATAKASAKQACWNCHSEHGAKDNVFVQFYPRLRDKD
ncbi:MAG: cytochrome P460 family protein [Bryobacteraceae bacterium]